MAKKRRGEKPRELTKRQLSRWQAQQKRQRIIIGTGIFTIAAILIIVLAGWYTSSYRPVHVTVITVNGAKFNMQYYIDSIKLRGQAQLGQYGSLVADFAVRDIEQSALVRQQAEQLGISVTDDAVKQKLKSSNMANDSVHRDAVLTQLLAEKVRDDSLAKQVPTKANQAHIAAMLLESEQQAADVRARLEKGESFTDLAGQLSLDPTTKGKKGDLGWHPQDVLADTIGLKVPGDYAFGSEAGVLSQPRSDEAITKNVGYWLIKVQTGVTDTTATVSAMLLGSQQEALDIKAKLAAGEDFAALAKQSSQLGQAPTDGGDLGAINKGDVGSAAFDAYVFDPAVKVGVVSDPVRDNALVTKGGYWLVKVLEKADDRPIDDGDLLVLKNKALNDWVTSLSANPDNKIDDSYLTADRKAWAVNQALRVSGR